MIKFFRNLQDSWPVKIILILTVVSFMSFFGVGGMTQPSSYKGPAIKVDGVEITAEKLERELLRKVKRFKMIYGGSFDMKQALSMGFLGEIIKRDTSGAILKAAAKDFGISVSDESVAMTVRSMREFNDSNNNFDEWRFKRMLQTAGWSENEYLETLRDDIARSYLLRASNTKIDVPNIVVDKIYAYRNEKRIAETININIDDIKLANKPKEEALKKLYEAKKSAFMAPEYRKISYVAITPEIVEEKITVDEKLVKQTYKENKKSYVTPEKRYVLQMVFDNENFKENGEKKSSQIAKKINNKEDFFKLAEKQLSQTKQDTKLGWVTKDSLLAELSEDIFNAKQGEVIGPIKSQFGWHLAMVTDKKEEVKVPYAEASIDIKAGLKRQKALDMLYDIATNLDDELGRGTELKKAAEINNLEYKTIDMIDIDGKDENEKFVDNPINSEEFLNVAFSTFLDEESQLEEFNGGYFVLRVDEIIDAKPKKFNQVKDSLIKIWKNNKKQSVAKVEAEKALAKIIDGQSVKSVANKLGYDYEKTEAIKRTESKEVPASVTAEIFRLNVGDASMNISKNGFVVSKLSKIIKAKENKSQKTKLSQKLKKDFGQDLSTGLIASLSRQYDVKINEEVLEKAFYSRYDN